MERKKMRKQMKIGKNKKQIIDKKRKKSKNDFDKKMRYCKKTRPSMPKMRPNGIEKA